MSEVIQMLRDRVGANASIPKVVKFDLGDDGTLRVDGTSGASVMDETDGPADVTVSTSGDVMREILAGDLNPQMAFMGGKLKIAGDMGVAMQLTKLLG